MCLINPLFDLLRLFAITKELNVIRSYLIEDGLELLGGVEDPGADGGLGAPIGPAEPGADGIFGTPGPLGAVGLSVIIASISNLKSQNGQVSGYTPSIALTIFPHSGQSYDWSTPAGLKHIQYLFLARHLRCALC